MPSDTNHCHPRAHMLHMKFQLLYRKQLDSRTQSSSWALSQAILSTPNFIHGVWEWCMWVCWKFPFVCVTQNTGSSTYKSRFLLDQLEKICFISVYGPNILLRESMLNTCCKSEDKVSKWVMILPIPWL